MPKLGLHSLCENAIKMWEDLRVGDDIVILTNFVGSTGSSKKEDAQKLLVTLEGDVALTVDDVFSRLKAILQKISVEANLKSLASFVQDIFRAASKDYIKVKQQKDEVMNAYNEFPKIDPAVFINTVNAEIATI